MMVQRWGLSETLGPVSYGEQEEEVFLGRSVTQHKTVAEETARMIDGEVRRILDEAYNKATALLKEHEKKMHVMADALMKYETIDVKQIDAIMDGKEPPPPEDWSNSSSGDGGDQPPPKATDQRGDGSIGGPAEQT